jgi:fumarylpyruvate hydrolase
MTYIFPPSISTIAVPIIGRRETFPVRRIFCVGRNYAAHAREMGSDPMREEPFFFTKPADAIVAAANADNHVEIPYPPMTEQFHHELELVLALGAGGKNIAAKNAMASVFGFAVGLDLTRRDLQNAAKAKGQPWDMAKAFDHSAPLSPIYPYDGVDLPNWPMELRVNGMVKQSGHTHDMIWPPADIIAKLSAYVELMPGDLIFTGTPEGVGPLSRGDEFTAAIGDAMQLRGKIV